MAVITPPLFQTIDAEYDGSHLGLPYRDFISEGVVGSGDLQVTQRGAGANMSVDVAAGVAWIRGDDSSAYQPLYRVYNDGTVNVTVTAADPTNPRIDRVIAEVRDAAFSGVSTDWRIRVVAGTPAGSPSAPALPNNAITLATLSVPALDTTIGTAQITDGRPLAQAGYVSGLESARYVTVLPTNPYDGQVVAYGADEANGVVWMLRYRAAATGSYKWDFLGGPPMRAVGSGSSTTTSATFVTVGSVGPTLTVPRPGDYAVHFGCQAQNNTAAAVGYIGIKNGSASTVDADSTRGQAPNANYDINAPAVTIKMTVTAAATALLMQFRTNAGTLTVNNGAVYPPFINATPIRLG